MITPEALDYLTRGYFEARGIDVVATGYVFQKTFDDAPDQAEYLLHYIARADGQFHIRNISALVNQDFKNPVSDTYDDYNIYEPSDDLGTVLLALKSFEADWVLEAKNGIKIERIYTPAPDDFSDEELLANIEKRARAKSANDNEPQFGDMDMRDFAMPRITIVADIDQLPKHYKVLLASQRPSLDANAMAMFAGGDAGGRVSVRLKSARPRPM